LQSILTFHNTVYFDLSLYHRVYVYYRLRPSAKELRIIILRLRITIRGTLAVLCCYYNYPLSFLVILSVTLHSKPKEWSTYMYLTWPLLATLFGLGINKNDLNWNSIYCHWRQYILLLSFWRIIQYSANRVFVCYCVERWLVTN
jgi:hypothetical protein